LIVKLFQKKTISLQKQVSKDSEDLTVNLSNTFSGLEILKLNNIEDKFTTKSFSKIKKLEQSKFKFNVFSESQRNITNTLGFLIFILILIYLIGGPVIDYAKMMLLVQFSMTIVFALPDIFPRYNVVKSSAEIYEKITKPDYPVLVNGKPHNFSFKEKLEVKNLNFSYDNKQIFDDASFTIQKGKKYLIKGPSGIGKSTLIKLLSQTYENYEGEILIDGVDLKTIKNKSISENIAFVYQDVFLFKDTIKNNITLYRDLSDDKVRKAIELSGLSEFMKNKTLDDLIEENGKNLSGGERQRISIARAIAKNAEILFIDEGTSALNPELGSEIEEKIVDLNTTVIAISHRYYPGVSEKYDYVLEISDGKVTTYESKDYFQAEAKYV
jgi:ABC-type multidrug transport system fused ATPase/permease subunit